MLNFGRSRLCVHRIRSFSSPNQFENVHQRIAGRQRFYKHVDVKAVDDAGVTKYQVYLDGRKLRTPARNLLQFESAELALAIAAEWDAQTCEKRGIQPATMPMMMIAATAMDQILPDPSFARKTCLSYLPTDTVLFWTDEEDRILLKKQRQHFEPMLRWVHRTFGMELKVSKSGEIIGRLEHSEKATANAERIINNMDHFSLACLQSVTMECKSLVMALAFLGRYITLEQCIAASRIEEEFQVEIWGVVEGGHDMDRLNNAVSLSAAGLFFGLIHDSHAHSKLISDWTK